MRTLKTKPLIGIIANSTSPSNRDDLINELGPPKDGLFNPLRFSYKDFKGEIIPIDIQPNDVLQTAGFFRAKAAMFKAVEYLVSQGAEVICFTASTKRLAGKSGKDIKKLYPNQTFTIGDNATIISFQVIMEDLFSGLNKEKDKVVCVGDGYIGGMAMHNFLKHGFKKIYLVSEQIDKYQSSVKVVNTLEKLPKDIKLMASCSHKYQPVKESFETKFTPFATIVEVAVPPMVGYELFQNLNHGIERLDAGDFFLPHIDYHFSPQILGFPEKGFWYGCFTEAVMLTLAHYDGYDTNSHDFFSINGLNAFIITQYLKKEEVYIPFINFYSPKVTKRIKL